MPARIRHIALSVKDIDATADFYEKAFGLKRWPKSEGPTAFRVYMSDGEINLALLQYKSEVGSGLKNSSASTISASNATIWKNSSSKSNAPAARSSSTLAIRTTTTSSASSRIRTASSSMSIGRHHLRCQLEGMGHDLQQGQSPTQDQVSRHCEQEG